MFPFLIIIKLLIIIKFNKITLANYVRFIMHTLSFCTYTEMSQFIGHYWFPKCTLCGTGKVPIF